MLRSFLIGVLMVAACGGGCSSSLKPPKADGSTDAGPVCPATDTTRYCGSWSAILANPSCGNLQSYGDCGPYHVQVVDQLDTFEAYYFDVATGDCVAAYSGNGGWVASSGVGAGAHCIAGPSPGITGPCAPGGPGPWTSTPGICGADGGRDAPSSTDGPSDARASSD